MKISSSIKLSLYQHHFSSVPPIPIGPTTIVVVEWFNEGEEEREGHPLLQNSERDKSHESKKYNAYKLKMPKLTDT